MSDSVSSRRAPVVPNRVTLSGRLAARAVSFLASALGATFRWSLEDRSGLLVRGSEQRVIFAVWHNRVALSPLIYRRYVGGLAPGRRLTALVSASKDGAVATRVMENFGARAVRGSSSRRGAQALAELADAARAGQDLAITPDGPRGPRYRVQPGVIALAQFTGLPVVPAACYLSAKRVLRSWDGFQVPLPFTRCEVAFGEPLVVPRRLDEGRREEFRSELERRLVAITRD